MAAQAWTAEHPLAYWLVRAPHAFEFFQALHLIERLARETAPIGHQDAKQEPVRLRPSLDLVFPSGDLESAEWRDQPGDARGRVQLTTTFLGLYGSDSPLPTHFTEMLLRGQEEEERVRNFLDLFHHRLLSLLYRVWKKYRYHVTFALDGTDPISEIIRGLLGVLTSGLAEQFSLPPVRLFRYVGLFVQRPRSASGLTGLLRDFFKGVPFAVQQCVGRWLPIDPTNRNRFGEVNCTLGQDFLLGERIFDRSGKYRVRIGPVGLNHYVRFLPPGDEAAHLREIARFYCGDPLEFDLELILRGDEVPATGLGVADAPPKPGGEPEDAEQAAEPAAAPAEPGLLARLSWTTWLKSRPGQDRAVVFRVPTN